MVEQATQSQDGVSKTTPSLQIRRITKKQAQPVIEAYHYSHHVPPAPGAKFFGWFYEDFLFGEQLYAVALYGLGANKHSAEFLAKEICCKSSKKNGTHLKRT